MRSTISSKGQVTVPVSVRERLGLVAGTAVQFELRDEGVLMKKGGLAVHPVDAVFGVLRAPHPKDSLALIDEMRGPRPGGKRRR